MFQFGYTLNELRRRLGRTLVTALGLAAGVGLVIGIIGVSQGLDEAQAKVLAPLSSIGTDILVTRVAGSSATNASATPSPTPSASQQAGTGGGPGFFARGPGGAGALNAEDVQALEDENKNVVTDLSKLGKAGTHFTHDFFLSATLLSFPDAAVDEVSKLPGVSSATSGLTLLAEHQTGTVPAIVAELKTGGDTVQQNVTIAPPTDKEQAAINACLKKNGFSSPNDGGPSTNTNGGPAPTSSGDAVQGSGPGPGAFRQCLPERFRNFRATFTTPLRTIQQVVNPPQTDITTTSYNVAGIDPSSPRSGLVTLDQLSSGKWLSTTGTNEVLAARSYANKNNLKVGSTIKINGKTYTIVGLVNPTLTGSSADLYFPLATLQKMAGKDGRVTQVLVKVSKSSDVDAVVKEIEKALPGAQVVTTKSLADQVTGSLSDAKKLASRLGGALGVIVLAAAFIIAVLLTLSSIAKRVREIGTLRAIGWSKSRVVRQMLAEAIGIGILGGIAGVAIGFAAASAVGAFTPALTATTTGVPNAGSSSLAQFFNVNSSAQTSRLSLHAPVHVTTLLLGIAFAVLGGLIAGAIGGWRAARLAPAEALRTVG